MTFFALPADISLDILGNWLGNLHSLTRLDVACARSVRQAYTSLLQGQLLMPHSISLCSSQLLPADLSSCIQWLNSRRVRLESLCVDAAALAAVCVHLDGDCVERITRFQMTSMGMTVDLKALSMILSRLPRLTSFDATAYCAADDEYLTILAAAAGCMPSPYRLQKVMLDQHYSCTNLFLLVEAFRESLQVLDLGGRKLNDSQFSVLCQSCCQLRELSLDAAKLSADALADNLASSNALPSLESLVLENSAADVTQVPSSVLLDMCRHHPRLTRCVDYCIFATTLSCCAQILACCPMMTTLQTSAFAFTVTDSNSGRCCELEVLDEDHEDLLRTELRSIAAVSRYPIASISDDQKGIGSAGVRAIVEVCGSSLHTLSLDLLDDVDTELLQCLASTCNAVQALTLHGRSCLNLNDAFLQAIADHCTMLTQFSLVGSRVVTNDGMQYMLQQIGHRLTNLSVMNCVQLSNPMLMQAVSCCLMLTHLQIFGTGITMVAIRELLILPDALKKLIVFNVDRDLLASIHATVSETSRWRAISRSTAFSW